jgi:GNAT superfamily N-acetyltransferase
VVYGGSQASSPCECGSITIPVSIEGRLRTVTKDSTNASSVRIKKNATLLEDDVVALYRSVGWTQYTAKPECLMRALAGSQCVLSAHVGEALVGLARCVTDGVSVVYVQDVLVEPGYQRLGVGTSLMKALESEYEHVPLKVLLTDDTVQQTQFYTSVNFENTRTLKARPLNVFIRIEGQ